MASLKTENFIQIFIAYLDHFIARYYHKIRLTHGNDAREAFYLWCSKKLFHNYNICNAIYTCLSQYSSSKEWKN